MRDVAAVIVTYDRRDLLECCIEHVLAQEKVQCDLIVIDNASMDGTAEFIEKAYGNSQKLIYLTLVQILAVPADFKSESAKRSREDIPIYG